MKSYPLYQDTGIKWLGRIPNSWCVKRIKHNTYVKGRVGWQGLNSNEFGSFGPCLVTGTDFKNGRIDWETCYHVSIERYDEDPFIQLQNQDLLITKDGTIGKVAIVENLKGHATLNSGVFVSRPLNNDYITPYLYWLLNSNVFNLYIDYTKTGSTVQHLYQATFVEFSFPVPSIPEQQAIADYLDRKTAQIDTLIAKKQRQIELLQEQRTAIINQAVTKGLDPSVSMKDSGIVWLGELPSHWEISKLKRVADVIDGDRSTEYPNERDFVETGIPFLSSKNIIDNELDYSHLNHISKEKFDRLGNGKLVKGDIVVTVRGTIGNVGHFDGKNYETAFINAQMMLLRPKIGIESSFLYYLARSNFWFSQLDYFSYGAAQQQLSNVILRNITIPLPSLSEQSSIVNFLELKTAQIDKQIQRIRQSIFFLGEYRTSLISEAVTGKIDIRGES